MLFSLQITTVLASKTGITAGSGSVSFMRLLAVAISGKTYLLLSLGEGNGTPLQYSCLENPMDRGAWWAAVPGIAESQTRLNGFTFHFPALEKEMAVHSGVPAWRILGMGEPVGLSSIGLHRVGHD